MAQLLLVIVVALPLLALWLYPTLKRMRYGPLANFPAVKADLVWGHMKALNEYIVAGNKTMPGRHTDYAFQEMWKDLDQPPWFVLDIRPLGYMMLCAATHEAAEAFTKVSKEFPWSYPKSPTFSELLDLAGHKSILVKNGEEWKSLRKSFNPGFAPQHLMTLLPCVLEKNDLFIRRMERHAKDGQDFSMAEYMTCLTFDIIGSVVMDHEFHAQDDDPNKTSELLDDFRNLVETYHAGSNLVPFWLKIPKLIRRRKLGGKISRDLQAMVRQKFAELQAETESTKKRSRSVLALTLKDLNTQSLPFDVLDQTCDQLKVFLFAGHDTTAITMQWAFYELARTPHALARLRAELDDIFGADTTDPAAVRDAFLERGEDVMRRLSYTNAIIKEILRLYPPAGTARWVPKGSNTMLPRGDGTSVCVDGLVVYNCHYLIQRDERVYGPNAHQFVPERWLGNEDTSEAGTNSKVSEKGEKGVPAGAWRPFERGPRNCIGQELANIEARVILACAARRYDFVKVGLGELEVDGEGKLVLDEEAQQFRAKSPLYNKMQLTSTPVDGCRMRVKLSEKAKKEVGA